MSDTCRDSVAISLLSEEAREGCEATDSWWLSLTIDVPVWSMAGRARSTQAISLVGL